MEDGSPERRGGEPCQQVDEGDGAGLSGLVLLLLAARPALPGPGDGAARGEHAEPGSGSLGGLARSLQKAEAKLRSCVSPGLRRLLPLRPRQRGDGSGDEDEDEEEEEEEAPALPALLELSFPGLRRCLCVWEDPRTETFRGHVRPQPGDGGAFSRHPVRPRVAERGAALHALLRHRHLLRLARDYARRLQASSAFLRRLLALPEQPEPPGAAQPLRGLCQELQTHAGHWSALRRRMRGDPWLRPLLLRRHESVAHMRRALLVLALHAAQLAKRHAEARLRGLARAGAPAPALLSDLFQGLEIYNQVLGDLALELGIAGITGCHGTTGDGSHALSAARVLGVLAAERGRLVAERLWPLLQPRDGGAGAEHVCWEDTMVPWPPERWTAPAADVGPSGREEPPGLAGELRALCREDEELMGLVLGALVASADSLWHHVLHEPPQEGPAAGTPDPPEPRAAEPGTVTAASPAGWKSVRWLDASRAPAAAALHAQYRPLLWAAAGTALGQRLGLPHHGTGTAAALELSRALAQAPVPRECQEELGRLCLRLLCRSVLRGWERDFARALGSALSDKCSGEPAAVPVPVCSRTARCLQRLYPALAFALRCLRPLPACPHGRPPCLRLQVLGCCLATAHAACTWLMGSACRHLAAWAVPQFLLVTQGDLQLLQTETDRLVVLVSGTFPEPGDTPLPPALSPPEHQLCRQIRSTAASIQLFSGDVLKMFSSDCKRMSAEIFGQTMPLGKHWRVGLRADVPSSPSAYAAAAAQAVLGQVLQVAQLLPRDTQAPTLARVTTAFLEAWMDHILAQRIKFSLQGALQLRQDFELVRELLGSERYGLAPETRQSLLALRVFQQMDGAILCLLQQPGGAAGAAPRPWHSLRRCCSDHGAHPPDPHPGTLHALDALESPAPGTPPLSPPAAEAPSQPHRGVPESYLSPEPYLSPHQQQWLALRLHRARRWRVPGLPCVGSPET